MRCLPALIAAERCPWSIPGAFRRGGLCRGGSTRCLGKSGQLGGLALVGMALVVLGGLMLPLHRFGDVRLSRYLAPATILALLAAMGTAGYSVVDDAALRILRAAPGLTAGPLIATALYSFFEGASSSMLVGAAGCDAQVGGASNYARHGVRSLGRRD